MATLLVVCVASPNADGNETSSTDLLVMLVGNWHGQAVRTPIGPHPYDINFSRQADGTVAGVADTGDSLHHWAFMQLEGQLRVRFLTTFRGNTDPIWLNVESRVPGTFSFRAERPAHLRVDISPTPDRISIGIFLHEAPHVDIVLIRKP